MTTWESQLQDYSYKLFFCVHGTVHPYNIVLVNNQREAAFVLLGLLSLHSNIIVTRKDVLIWCKKEDHHTTLSSWTPKPHCTQIQRTYTSRNRTSPHTHWLTHTGGCHYSFVYYFWRWTRTAPETCRVIINQVKQKLHLVGYLLIQSLLSAYHSAYSLYLEMISNVPLYHSFLHYAV